MMLKFLGIVLDSEGRHVSEVAQWGLHRLPFSNLAIQVL